MPLADNNPVPKPKQNKKIAKLLKEHGVVRISHRRPVSSKTIEADLKQIGKRLGRRAEKASSDKTGKSNRTQ